MKKQKLSKEKNLETFLVLVLALLVIGYLTKKPYLNLVAIGVGVIGLFIPVLANWISYIWLSFSEILGGFMSKVLLSLVFYLVLLPVALLKKLLSKKIKKSKPKWIIRDHTYTPNDLKNPW